MEQLQNDYPWTKAPLLIGAPMRLISLAPLAVEVSRAGGIGFIGAGSDLSPLPNFLTHAHTLLHTHPIPNTRPDILPLGIGILNWGASLPHLLPLLHPPNPTHPPPAALWLFAPHDHITDLPSWVAEIRGATAGATKIWVQTGCVADAVAVVRACRPDVLVVQGADAGGHGLKVGAGLTVLLPETVDAVARVCRGGEAGAGERVSMPVVVAAGGIMDGRGVVAARALGADGMVLGTRLLATPESSISAGYRAAVLRAGDGGQSTRRTGLYDQLRGTTGWPERYGGRGVLNKSWEDAEAGMGLEENKRLHDEVLGRSESDEGEEGWAEGSGRLTTYAGTGVGLVTEVKRAGDVIREVREDSIALQKRLVNSRL